jgi:hypothetical protein
MWRRVDLVWTDVSEETPVHTTSAQRQNPENGIIYSHRCENLKSYTVSILSSFIVYSRKTSLDEEFTVTNSLNIA